MPSLARFCLQGLVSLVLTHFASNSVAQTSQTCGAERVVYTINGVLTDAGGAQEIADVMEEGYIGAYATDTPLPRFKALHNPSGKKLLLGLGGALDFIEALRQLTGLTVARLIRMITGLELIEDPYNAIIGQIMSEAAVSLYNPDGVSLNRMISNVGADIDQGSKVVLVAHSQGNLWANSLIALVNNPARRAALAQVGVGVPDFRLEKSPFSHVTLTEDFVIRPIPFSLAANVTNGYGFFETLSRTLGHSFTNAYMEGGRPSQPAILSRVKGSFASLTAVPNPSGQGPFTVTLTWGAQPDVDLHVFEPNGVHVYYRNRQGVAGFLDVDDVTSFGPEHYYSNCARIVTGEYRIGVNYYFGRGPETASVLIQAGTVSFSKQVPLPVALGSGGDANPTPVARVVLQRNPVTGEIEAAIVP